MKTKISAFQLFCATVLVPYGTAVLFLITPEAKQDAWIAMFIYIIPAVILQYIYLNLWNKYPEDTIVTYMPKIFGNFFGYTLSIIYIVFFSYETSRSTRDIIEIIDFALMPKASMYLIGIVFIVTVIYGTHSGIENISRIGCIFLALFVLLFLLEWLFIYTTPGAVKFYNLKPVLENGILPVIKEGWILITFPYGESIVLTMLFPAVVEKTKVKKAVVFGTVFLGIILSINSILFISVLGVSHASSSLLPLAQTLRIMKIGEVFDRLDVLIILILLMGAFIKVCFYLYGTILGIAQIIKLKDTKNLALPVGFAVLIVSYLIASNYPQHIYIGQKISLIYIHFPLEVLIPVLALLVYYFKKLFKW